MLGVLFKEINLSSILPRKGWLSETNKQTKNMSICKILLNDKTVKCRIDVPINLVRYSVFYIIIKYIL